MEKSTADSRGGQERRGEWVVRVGKVSLRLKHFSRLQKRGEARRVGGVGVSMPSAVPRPVEGSEYSLNP